MIHIHPFPARMAPEIALRGLEDLPKDSLVLDPMSGSGMVLGTAAKLGLNSIGYDLDPLACMISRTNGRQVNVTKVQKASEKLLSLCHSIQGDKISLPWIDEDEETRRYIDFWFGKKQQEHLRALSYLLIERPFINNMKILDILRITVSRLIVTKEPKASFARDTAHSRPHRTITENDFDVFSAIPKSLSHVLKALRPKAIKTNVKAYRGDARKMGRIRDSSVDCIITSPPYLNAIDYMRGHRLSLVWLGHTVSELRKIRARSVGTEIVNNHGINTELLEFWASLHSDINEKKRRILKRYYLDLYNLTKEAYRVLRPGKCATYVMGNSSSKGHEIRNSELLTIAAMKNGFRVREKYSRVIPENRRYMPLMNSGTSSLSKRMRSEHIIVFEKGV